MGDLGEWSVREIGEVRGFGGSTGCPECKVVNRKEGGERMSECMQYFIFEQDFF